MNCFLFSGSLVFIYGIMIDDIQVLAFGGIIIGSGFGIAMVNTFPIFILNKKSWRKNLDIR